MLIVLHRYHQIEKQYAHLLKEHSNLQYETDHCRTEIQKAKAVMEVRESLTEELQRKMETTVSNTIMAEIISSIEDKMIQTIKEDLNQVLQ